MIALTKRNLLVFFRDKSAVFFSFLAVFIIIGLYALFLGDVWVESFTELEGVRYLMDSWIMAGVLAVTSLTTTMGAFSAMVDDKTKKIVKDINSAPVSRSAVTGGYVLSAYIIGVIMSLASLVLAEIYIVAYGGELMDIMTLLKVVGLIFFSCFANIPLLLFAVSLFNSSNAFAAASTIIGTLIGFLTGIYLPVGNLPEGVQTIVKIFPPSHSAALFRQVMTEKAASVSFAGAPQQALDEFNEFLGVTFRFGDYTVTPLVSVVILIATAVVFYLLSVISMRRKKK
ncbi:MAG: ABC transporter permease [Clostridiales bacterium]|nr:ABC transporter permease [Clostridiales bacterium]